MTTMRTYRNLRETLSNLKKNTLVWHKVADSNYPPYERGNYSINVLTDCGDDYEENEE